MRRALGLYFGRGPDGERPPLATVLFWFGLLLPLPARLWRTGDDRMLPVGLLLVGLVLVLVLWPRLEWQPTDGRWKTIVLFTLASVFYLFVEGSGNSMTLLLVVLANVVITLGVWQGLVATAILGVAMLVTIPLVYGGTWENALLQSVGTSGVGLATVAVAQVISSEQRRRLQAAGLLTELQTAHGQLQLAHEQLADAHQQLQDRADQARELAVAEERARLAREVHDAVGHHLTVVKLGLTNALRLHDRGADEAAWEEVAEARLGATSALDEVRRAVRAMGPGPLAEANLGTALADLVASFGRTELSTSFEVAGAVRPLGPTIDATLYRVTEEALTNVRRHAVGAERADVRLVYQPEAVTLTVVDDGRGDVPLVPGFGLAGAKARLAEVGGTLDLSDHDGGVELRATVTTPPPTDALPASALSSPLTLHAEPLPSGAPLSPPGPAVELGGGVPSGHAPVPSNGENWAGMAGTVQSHPADHREGSR